VSDSVSLIHIQYDVVYLHALKSMASLVLHTAQKQKIRKN